jgi:hypothetical protein
MMLAARDPDPEREAAAANPIAPAAEVIVPEPVRLEEIAAFASIELVRLAEPTREAEAPRPITPSAVLISPTPTILEAAFRPPARLLSARAPEPTIRLLLVMPPGLIGIVQVYG